MDIETVRQISLARHLHELGEASLRTNNDLHLFAAVNLLQDAVESFLIAISGSVNANIDQNTKFDKYFVEINSKIHPNVLPFKLALTRLNRIRIDSKHYGIQPARDECNRLAISVREFFNETSNSILNVSFSTISAIDLLEDGEAKRFLLTAKAALEKGEYEECIIECRKAIFVEIESGYDISEYINGQPRGLLSGFTKAPSFARNQEYIALNVRTPLDFIVIDHTRLDQELLKQGADPVDYWNLYRLTPPVYRPRLGGEWVVKYDFVKLDANSLTDNVEYIFSTTVDLVLDIHAHKRSIKMGNYATYSVELARENVPVFAKADLTSDVLGYSPNGLKEFESDYHVIGLNGAGRFYHVSYFGSETTLYGFISVDDVK